jgi:superfamily II DNA or RNA helicase
MITLKGSKNANYVWLNQKISSVAIASLDKTMSYTMESYENPPYTVHLLKQHEPSKAWFFPIGMVSEAIETLEELGYDVEYIPGHTPSKATIDHIRWLGPTLWEHQEKARNMTLVNFYKGLGVILHIPTRGGKSVIAMKLISDLQKKTLIIVHNEELMRQWKNEIKEKLGINAGEIQETKRDIKNVTVAMIQTLNNAIKKGEKFNFDFLIIDEVHHYSSAMFYYVAMRINSYYRLGLSATPRREDGDDKKFIAAIGQIVHPVSIHELIQRRILVKPIFKFYKCKVTEKTGYESWAKSYTKGIVQNDERNNLIAKITNEHKDKQIYIHVTRIPHGKQLAKLIPRSVFVCGKDNSKTREKVLRDFKNNEIQCCISTLLGEGVDVKTMDIIINAAGGRSWTSYIQRLGRVLTASENKCEALVIDFLDYGHKWHHDHSQRRMEIIREMFPSEELVIL